MEGKHFLQSFHRSISWQKNLLEHDVLQVTNARIIFILVLIALLSGILGLRLFDVMLLQRGFSLKHNLHQNDLSRYNILDRNGKIIATQLATASVYANPRKILDPKKAVIKLAKLLPHIDKKIIESRINSKKSFVWLARHVTPKMQASIHNAGIPGIDLRKDSRRIYPHGELVSHVIGLCNRNGEGVSGLEKQFDHQLLGQELKTSLDIRAQYATFNVLNDSIKHFKAKAGNAIVMDIKNGEILSLVSLPTFNPNKPQAYDKKMFNRNTQGVYEVGSTFKIFNIAIALESGKSNLQSKFDASKPIKIGRFTITDFRGPNRIINLAEAFTMSSNIAMVQIARKYGLNLQKKYLKKFGILTSAKIEIPEISSPILPLNWQESSMMSISYGYGLSVSPMQMASAVAGIVNDGLQVKPTLLLNNYQGKPTRLISNKNSKILRELMRLVVTQGTARKANIPGYGVFAKTGTAYQAKEGTYGGKNKSRTTSFIGVFPYHNPRYLVLVMLDDPKPLKETSGFATAGWNATPTGGKLIEKLGPILNIKPHFEKTDGRLDLVMAKITR